MPTSILATKLYIPPLRPKLVLRPHLIERLNEGLYRKLTLISAPAGFGKTTIVSEWVARCQRPVAWLSLDEADNDPARFLTYLVSALQTLVLSKSKGTTTNIGNSVLGLLQTPQPPSPETILTALLNEITTIPDHFILVLDDYHLIDAQPVDHALTFLLQHLPPQMHLAITTREDPNLPLARLRAQGQLAELRATDLRFNLSEATGFLTQVMGLDLSIEDIATLEARTEGWIAGLQLAAISMRGHQDAAHFIRSFSGSHQFVMDYLVEEVLQQQPESVQTFLLRTSILERLCGPLCDAVLLDSSASGQETLEYLQQANLFLIPLDNERRWYRYHHLFADLLRQRLHHSPSSSAEDEGKRVAAYHKRASQWYEENNLEIDAFHHAAAAHDIERAERLIEGKGMPLHFRGAVTPVLNWLKTLSTAVLDAWPSLWTTYASVLLVTGKANGVEQVLQAAEAALRGAELNDKNKDLIGRVAAIRATAAVSQNQVETIITQSRRALEYLHPTNLAFRTATAWKLGFAYQIQGNRPAASRAYTEVISVGQASGNMIFTLLATIGLGMLQEAENQLYHAAATYQNVLQLMGDQPLPFASEAYFGLARVCYEWNDLEAAQQHVQQSVQLARMIENNDRFVAGELFLVRLKLAQGDVTAAAALLAQAEQTVHQHKLAYRLPEVAAAQVLMLLHQGKADAAAHLAQTYELPLSQARVHLAQGNPSHALAVLEPLCQQMETRGWADERLKVMVLQTVAHQAQNEKDRVLQLLGDALAVAEPGGFIRLFVDEGLPMANLLSEAAARGIMPNYTSKLLAVFNAEAQPSTNKPPAQPLIEPLSERELEVLHLIAQGLSNHEIGQRLFLALSTVKGHNRNIYDKLQVQRRTEAVARGRELGLL